MYLGKLQDFFAKVNLHVTWLSPIRDSFERNERACSLLKNLISMLNQHRVKKCTFISCLKMDKLLKAHISTFDICRQVAHEN